MQFRHAVGTAAAVGRAAGQASKLATRSINGQVHTIVQKRAEDDFRHARRASAVDGHAIVNAEKFKASLTQLLASETPKLLEHATLNQVINLPPWLSTVALRQFDGTSKQDELQLVATQDVPTGTILALVSGKTQKCADKFTIRLREGMHLFMDDGSGESVWTRCNHSFDPNCSVTPQPHTRSVVWTAKRDIVDGEALCFDYTTTEDAKLATPFVDIVTGARVGY